MRPATASCESALVLARGAGRVAASSARARSAPAAQRRAQVQAALRAALRHVPPARRRRSRRAARVHGGRGLHRARGQRHARPARRRCRSGSARRSRGSNMRMGVFVAHTIDWNEPTLTSPATPRKRETFLKEVRESVEVAKRVNAKWMTVVPGHVDRAARTSTTRPPTSSRRSSAACAILEPHGLVMVLEPLNTLRNHPGHVPDARLRRRT